MWHNVLGIYEKIFQIALDIRSLHDSLCRFKSVLVDPAEFACLKAIVLFRSETRGLKDPAQIENLQDQAQVMLIRNLLNKIRCTMNIHASIGNVITTLPWSVSCSNCTIRTIVIDVATLTHCEFAQN